MILGGNMFGSWDELGTLSNCNETVIVVPYCALEDSFLGDQTKCSRDFCMSSIKGITSLMAVYKAMYSLFFVLRANSV